VKGNSPGSSRWAYMAYVRRSRPDAGLGFLAKVPDKFEDFLFAQKRKRHFTTFSVYMYTYIFTNNMFGIYIYTDIYMYVSRQGLGAS
jgi:hypothetical protein